METIKLVVILGMIGTIFGYDRYVSKWYCVLWQIALLKWLLKLT